MTVKTPWPLSNGSTGAHVVTLQRNLNRGGYAKPVLAEDGSFEIQTEGTVMIAQSAHKLTVTGIVDETLWKILRHTAYTFTS